MMLRFYPEPHGKYRDIIVDTSKLPFRTKLANGGIVCVEAMGERPNHRTRNGRKTSPNKQKVPLVKRGKG